MDAAIPLKNHQHGFRANRSTVTALQETVHNITAGLNSKKPAKRTVLVAIDLSKAFDTVCHEQLLKDLLHLNISCVLKKFLCSYLRGRQQYTEFRGHKSKCRVVRQGVPQGGVLSPALFNLYLSSMPDPPDGIVLISYADDCQALASGSIISDICATLNPYLDVLAGWFRERKLEISAEKSTATLFTTWTNEIGTVLPIKMDGKEIPTCQNPKILGLTLDPLLNFGEHIKVMKERVQHRNNALKCLAGSTWGKNKEVLKDTYKAIGRSVLNYAAPIWTPLLSQSKWDELEPVQNAALRTISGCVKMSDPHHLNQECEILPVRTHSTLLTDQFLLAMHQEHHPNHHQLAQPPRARPMRENILSHKDNIAAILNNKQVITRNEFKVMNKQVHTATVAKTIRQYRPNKVLGSKPPSVNNAEEITLPRRTRTVLAQLRSGYSSHLQSFLHRINKAPDNLCPNCKLAPHTTQHLFVCPANPTNLTIEELWKHPTRAAEFLQLPTTEIEDTEDPG